MAKKTTYRKPNLAPHITKTEAPDNTGHITVVNHDIRVQVAQRGNQSIGKWLQAVKSAESVTMPRRRSLIDLYEDISIDAHLSSVWDKRVRAVSTVPFEWEGLENEAVQDNFSSPWFYNLLRQIMSHRAKGHTVIEMFIDPHTSMFNGSEIIPRKNVRPERQLITPEEDGETGFSYLEPPTSNFVLEIGNYRDLGIFSRVAPYVLMKRDNLGFWATFNELFGMPIRVYEYPAGDIKARVEVEKQAQAQAAAAYIIVPDGVKVNTLETSGGTASSSGSYPTLHDTLNREITIAILGQTLTTTTDGKGSYALGGIHKEVEEGVNLEDRLLMEYILNYQFKPLAIRHGYPLEGVRGYFQMQENVSSEKKQEMWNKAIDKGLPIAKEDYYTEFGIPAPGDREVLVVPAAQPSAEGDADADQKKKPSAMKTALSLLYESPSMRGWPQAGGVALSASFDSIWEVIAQRIFRGELRAGDVDQALFDSIAAELLKALDEGFGTQFAELDVNDVDYTLMQQLRQNVFVFSGFKTHAALLEATSYLIDEQGQIRTFAMFREQVMKVKEQYVENWLRTEYNMAVANADMARKWQDFERNKKDLPLLRYRSLKDEVARHKGYNGITRPVDDPIWDTLTPPIDWGCRCTLQQLSTGDITEQLPDRSLIKDQFAFNPGKQKVLFPKNHPYYDIADKERGETLFNLNVPN